MAVYSSLRRKPEPRCSHLFDEQVTPDSGLRRNDGGQRVPFMPGGFSLAGAFPARAVTRQKLDSSKEEIPGEYSHSG